MQDQQIKGIEPPSKSIEKAIVLANIWSALLPTNFYTVQAIITSKFEIRIMLGKHHKSNHSELRDFY